MRKENKKSKTKKVRENGYNSLKSKFGFTLIELIVVIVILGILVLLA